MTPTSTGNSSGIARSSARLQPEVISASSPSSRALCASRGRINPRRKEASLLLFWAILGADASAQTSPQAQRITGPLKSAGTYHLSSGSWTRHHTSAAFGPDVIYNNATAPLYLMPMGDDLTTPGGFSITDAGRLPSTSDVGDGDRYTIDGLTIGYCTGAAIGPNLSLSCGFDEAYAPCSGPGAGAEGSLVIPGLPTSSSSGVQACWLVTVDLAGASSALSLAADADGSFDSSPVLDNFGYTLSFSGQGADPQTGLILAGDPNISSFGDGTSNFGFGPGPDGTGLGQEDLFYIATGGGGSGCVNLGGYPGSPWSGLYVRMMGAAETGPLVLGADDCGAASVLPPGSSSVQFDTNLCADTAAPATTSTLQQGAGMSEDIWFQWTADYTGFATFSTCTSASFDTELAIWGGSSCGSLTALGSNDDAPGCGGLTSEISLPVTVGENYFVQLGYWSPAGGEWGFGELAVYANGGGGTDPCLPDNWYPNHTCLLAQPAPNTGQSNTFVGTLQDTSSQTRSDVFMFEVDGGEKFDLHLTTSDPDVNLRMKFYQHGSCSPSAQISVPNVHWKNVLGVTRYPKVEIFWSSATPDKHCVNYTIDYCTSYPGCSDFWSEDDCDVPPWLSDGNFLNLHTTYNNWNYWQVVVNPGATVTIDTTFGHAMADLDLFLWDADTTDCGTIGTGVPLAQSTSSTDNEQIVWTNNTGTPMRGLLQVACITPGASNNYDLLLSGTSEPIGTSYCVSMPNSTGTKPAMSAAGSASVTVNDLVLICDGLPHNQFGIFYYGPNQIIAPFGNGLRCVGGSTHRLPIRNSGATGSLSYALDYSSTVDAPIPPSPGSVWHIQCWYRDPAGGGSSYSLSDGYSIQFLP